jgi:hypothetical protein
MKMKLIPRQTYFLLGYLDEACRVPFVQTLVYLRSSSHKGSHEHIFADAIVWFRRELTSEQELDSSETLLVAEDDLDTVKDLAGLLQELSVIR